MVWVTVVVALLVVGVAVEWWVREWGVQEAAHRVARALEADVELDVVGRPLAWHVVRREIPEVVVVAEGMPVLDHRASLDRLEVALEGVRLRGRGPDQRASAAAGRFHLTLGNDSLLAMVTLPSYLVSFEVVPTGLKLQAVGGVFVDASVRVDADSLLVRPASSMLRLLPQPSFRLPLPRWPYGARVEGVTLHRGTIEAWGTLDPAELDVPARVSLRRPTP